MKDVWVRDKKRKFSLKCKVLLGALALAVILGLSTVVQAALDSTDNMSDPLLLRPTSFFFNPFTLQSTRASVNSNSSESDSGQDMLLIDLIKTRPPIRIPFRPVLRSPFRPPLIIRRR